MVSIAHQKIGSIFHNYIGKSLLAYVGQKCSFGALESQLRAMGYTTGLHVAATQNPAHLIIEGDC